MAPTVGKKRTSVRAKVSKPSKAVSSQATAAAVDESLFPSSKKDKRTIRHSSFVSRIEKSSSKTKRRRRPDKKLVANLESLAHALPDLGDDGENGEVVIGQAKIQRKSLKSRPGATKRKAKLEKAEKDRFNKNLAQLAGSTNGAGADATSIADRWAALKNHVQSTAEKKPEFIKT
ncbi:ribosome biogenesis protein SLX9-domain-containing protein [Clohesyomyces aquaticus]|uniref:Ribosome biogenesis protein SLX9 n=1 Tax=Clohesyomyces aquaticus TaxID=1231657 RepID=A0A1Y2A291_9PLEO|nr:ribosome biogenesis protein SLX9-domain-containing protein [Clohesyomyces aquaticus]